MIRVAALTSGRHVPSARFRVRQHIEPLRALGIEVREYPPAIDKFARLPAGLWRGGRPVRAVLGVPWLALKLATRVPGLVSSRVGGHQITWLEREMLPGFLTLEGALKKPLVLDVDDAIWLASPFGRSTAAAIARRATVVLAGNRYLAEWLSGHAREVRVIPTAIDTARFRPPETPPPEWPFVVGWMGTSSNLPFLEAIEAPLRRFLVARPHAQLRVVSDAPPRLRGLPFGQLRYEPWSERTEIAALQGMHVGLMPLADNDWTRGKCSFKMLQYMACGVPVAASPVGMNAEVLAMGQIGIAATTEADWDEALSKLEGDRGLAARLGRAGRGVVQTFSSERIAGQLAEVFRALV